jgi:hypothetical protein
MFFRNFVYNSNNFKFAILETMWLKCSSFNMLTLKKCQLINYKSIEEKSVKVRLEPTNGFLTFHL